MLHFQICVLHFHQHKITLHENKIVCYHRTARRSRLMSFFFLFPFPPLHILAPYGARHRLLRALHPGLPLLRVPGPVQHGGHAGVVRRVYARDLLLLLRRRDGRRLQTAPATWTVASWTRAASLPTAWRSAWSAAASASPHRKEVG